jgi:hypothetical protein
MIELKSWPGRSPKSGSSPPPNPPGCAMSLRTQDWDGPGTGFVITKTVAFPDTLGCLIPYPLPEDFWGQLYATGTGKIIPNKPFDIGAKLYQPIRVHQPTREMFGLLAGLQSCTICRVDISIDLICSSPGQATKAVDFLDKALLQRWHGKRRKNRFENTTYFSKKRRTTRNVAVYGDKPSKTGNGPCAHLELRFISADACRRAGMGEPTCFLAGIDVLGLLKHQTWLARLDARRFERQIEKMACDYLRKRAVQRRLASSASTFSTVEGLTRRTKSLIIRACSSEGSSLGDLINSQELVERRPALRDCLSPIAWEEVIPPPEWVILPVAG